MLNQLLTWLSNAMQTAPLVAVFAALIWGILSIILSPCHLASIPLIIGFINEQGLNSTRKAFRLSLLFAVGILVTISVIGFVTASLGRMMGDLGPWGNYLVAILFFVIGLHLLEVITLTWNSPALQKVRRKGYGTAFVLGLVFGVALGPCTFAYLAPMLGVVFSVAASQWVYALVLLLAFACGHCLVIVLAGTLYERVQTYLNWTEQSKGTQVLKKVCGVLVLLGGLYLLYTAR